MLILVLLHAHTRIVQSLMLDENRELTLELNSSVHVSEELKVSVE